MASLISPGISISVNDESAYLPNAVGTVPFVLFATAEDKIINGTTAPGTKKSNAGKIYGISSQRELIATFGSPNFRKNSAGSAIHGDELNEYGLMAAYSALGVGNRVWAMRADVNLTNLIGTTVRPTGEVPDGTVWLDTAETKWGIFEYDQYTDSFVDKELIVLSSLSEVELDDGVFVPKTSIGSIGSYAVVVRDANNFVWYKNSDNNWVQVGSDDWALSHPTIVASVADPDVVEGKFKINDIEITCTSSDTAVSVAGKINTNTSLQGDGVKAEVIGGYLWLYANTSSGLVPGTILIEPAGTPVSSDTLESLGLVEGEHRAPAVHFGGFNQIPSWSLADTSPRPSGSVWVKTSVSGGGTSFAVKTYSSSLKKWVKVSAPVYSDGYEAIEGFDAVAGGKHIPAGSFFVKYDAVNDGLVSFKLYKLQKNGVTSIAGSSAAGTFTVGDTFNIIVSELASGGQIIPVTYNCELAGVNAAAFVSAVLAANIPEVTASVNSSGVITVTHKNGGIITLVNTTVGGSNPVTTAGFTTSTDGVTNWIVDSGTINLTNWAVATYTYSTTEPYTAPDDGTLWYYSDPTAIDIMICDVDGWKGYKNVTRDIRGANLSVTDPNGVIVSPTEPETQSDNTALVPGDLWLDSSDLENYPKLYRRTGTNKWQLIDNSDRVTQNGIVFADARWDGDSEDNGGEVDPITGSLPSCAEMQNSNYVDLDAPDYRLYPRGTLLWNTRRSGYVVKKFVNNYFNVQSYPNDPLPIIKSTWVTESGLDDTGKPYTGHHAQRAIIVKALKAAIDGSLDIREEGYNFNLLVSPGYPELTTNLVALNNDRNNTGFIIGDLPMTLPATISSITSYNNTKATNRDPYVALYYPSALTNDLSGNEVAVPASHIMLRTYIRNDNLAYQWFAPAGTRRGLVDNANAIGYIDANTGLFIKTGINQSLRDAMYELNLNPITLLQGTGLVVYGQKTRSPMSSALDRVNVARLVNYLRTVLQPLANQFLFEPNDKITRDQIKQVCESVMNDLVTKRGIYDYLVVCDTSNNTPERIARNELYVDIAIEPMKAVEFIYIPIRLKNPGTLAGQ